MTKRLTIALVALVALILVAVLPVSATYYQVNNTINAGATVYVGETQLNLTPFYNLMQQDGQTQIAYWASGSDLLNTPGQNPQTLTADGVKAYSIAYATFEGYLGTWYAVNLNGSANTSVTLAVKNPTMEPMDVWDYNTSQSVAGKTVIQGDLLTFHIQSDLNEVYGSARSNANGAAAQSNVDIKLKSDTGNTYASVLNETGGILNIANPSGVNNVLYVNRSDWYLGTVNNQFPGNADVNGLVANALNGWYTGAKDSMGNNAYPAGTYTVWAESRINGMRDSWATQNSGADMSGKTVTQTTTVTIASNTVKIEANKDSVVRSKPFSVTITGRPNTWYYLWVKGISSMDNTYDSQAPQITANQLNVFNDDQFAVDVIVDDLYSAEDASGIWKTQPPYIGAYNYQNSGNKNLLTYVGGNYTGATVDWREFTYGSVKLSSSGTATVQFTTSNWTKAQKYTIRVEQNFGNTTVSNYKSDEVDVKVEKGAVTIVAAGDQSYYIGEEVKFSGTNTESGITYLFITGPNLKDVGSQIQQEDPRSWAVESDQPETFQQVDVLGDNTWSWKWGTANYALDAGTYTVYAVSQPKQADDLGEAAYGTVSIMIKKPFVSATASQSTVAQGDKFYITGTAEGQPSQGVMIWILGKNYAGTTTETVNSDSSFSYEVKRDTTTSMYAGQYFIVVQHPMQNDQFDVYPGKANDPGNTVLGMPLLSSVKGESVVFTVDQSVGTPTDEDGSDFKLTGSGSLQGSDAAEALIEAINDANVDDTYTKLQVLIENPVITIDTVGDRHVGDKFTITATTNLAVDDEVLFEVYSSSFQPTTKSQSGEFSGASGTVKVTQGDSGLNKLAFDVDASTFKPDEYLVKASAVLQTGTTGTALFNVLEATPTTVATTVVTTVAPTTVATTVAPTTIPTTAPTTTPGFGALIALIGLGAIAFVIVRRH